MGMAASQARFLGLTARKSNVEYQGQQINQQRTALANESANLYNQMMELNVPTPPSTNDFYKTSYVLENSSSGYADDDYHIVNMTKTYNAEGQYLVSLTKKVENLASTTDAYTYSDTVESTDENQNQVKTFRLKNNSTSNILALKYVQDANGNMPSAYKDGVIADISTNQLYAIDINNPPSGYEKCQADQDVNDPIAYFYQDAQGKNHFLSQTQLDNLLTPDTDNDGQIDNYNFAFATTYTYKQEVQTQVKAYLESSSNGRYTTIHINDDEEYPANLKGRTFSLSTVQEMDQAAYDQAMNDYEYNKSLYEKSISEESVIFEFKEIS